MTDDHDSAAHDAAMDAGLAALEETSNRLIAAVTDMSTRLNTTERMQNQLERQQLELKKQQDATRTQRKTNAFLGVSLVLDIVLSLAVGFGYFRIDGNADSIGQLQERTSEGVLCPLYVLFLQSVNHPRPEQVNTPEKKAAFEQAAATIREGYRTLECGS